MDKTLIETFKQWNITSVLPLSVGAFQLLEVFDVVSEQGVEKEFCLFRYLNRDNGWFVKASFNLSSHEFSVRVNIGMLEFSLIEFITDKWEYFQQMVASRLVSVIDGHYVHREKNVMSIVREKGITQVNWESFLPTQYKSFRRDISPTNAVQIINGSYMILSYYDVITRSGLSLMYNLLRDDFFAEQRVYNFPNLVHDFDSSTIQDVQRAVQSRLIGVLDELEQAVQAEQMTRDEQNM
ncbi:hypothetical protein [Megasphaera hutchinsoni]|uniref:Uncharacterized protein n=1 Tax=Megasphaera hutchinsoni TaxID=1588748 RepID=A0A134CFB1_9FIRM|nr:hypothetical protein [Megasphaera hutchinsoni]KXB90885.1 hypothetical protein HMPREF3182_00967 [Megasphaera hutchinsoni]